MAAVLDPVAHYAHATAFARWCESLDGAFARVEVVWPALKRNRDRPRIALPLDEMPQVGAADPERRNSPIQTDPEQSFELLREQIDEAAGCYFNDMSYANGTYVGSGTTVLRCERGIWVEAGTKRPE